VLADLDGEACVAAAAALAGAAPLEPAGHAVDIADARSVKTLLHAVLDTYGRVDVLVNNAAVDEKVGAPGSAAAVPFEAYPLAAFERALRVNVSGTFLCSQAFGGVMARAGAGSIVNIASTYGLVAPDQSLYREPDGLQTFYKSAAYPTSKAAVLGLTRYLGAYWGRSGVRVNALCPGGVADGQDEGFLARYGARTPMGRMARPAEYEGALVFLASDASSYMTGAALVVDGGWTAW
jgi:NAD(P)-dependent dehydrogenase (short-subunit alcohol dehydrogenase family)